MVAYLLLGEQLARYELIAGCTYPALLELPLVLPSLQFARYSG